MTVQLTTNYVGEIHFDGDVCAVEEVILASFKIADRFEDVECESFSGNPAAEPYITVSGANESDVQAAADEIEAVILTKRNRLKLIKGE